MAAKSRAALNTQADTDLADNTTGAILPTHVRGMSKDLADSMANLQEAQTFTAPQKADTLALVHNTAWDGSAKQHLTVTVNGSNFTIANPSALIAGVYYTLRVAYTTTHTLAWGANFKGVSAITPTATAGAVDHFTFRSDGTNLECVGYALNVAA